jgi:tetratricopeptide (TPR) repeat protein
LNSGQSRNAYLLGEAWFEAGDAARAQASWQASADSQDAPPQYAVAAAQLLIQANRFDEAAMLIQHIGGQAQSLPAYWLVQEALARKAGQRVFARIARGYAAYHSGDPWQAEAIWRAALPEATKDDAWALSMAVINSAEKRQDRIALPYATEAAKRFPHDYYILKKRADLLLGQNARAEALAVAEPLASIEPPEQAGQAADLVARIALKLGDVELLRRSVQRERAQAPRDASALLHLIEWQRRQQWTPANMESTLKLCKEAISVDPGNAEAYYRAGEVLKSMGRAGEAMTMLRHALTLNPRLHDGSLNALLSQIERTRGLLAESRYELREVKRLNELRDPWPTQMELLYREAPAPTLREWKTLGQMALHRHEPWVALCAATRANRVAPFDPEVFQMRATALSRLGRADEALRAMLAARHLRRAR